MECPGCGREHLAGNCPVAKGEDSTFPRQTELVPGQILEGKYRVAQEIGRGAMGVVYEGIHISLGRKVAIKTLLAELCHDAHLADRFQQEARAASAIGHPHIINVFDLGRTPDGIFFMVMELLVGESLADLVTKHPKLPIPLAIHLMTQVLSGLSAAHKHGIIHRDLKPENIFISQSDEHPDFVKILDFGISKVLTHAVPEVRRGRGFAGTIAGTVMGTPLYMAPEQAIGQVEHIDHRTDIYAAGVVLYEILCGRPPFDGQTYPEIMAALLEGTYPPPRSLRADIPDFVEVVIQLALQRERQSRFSSAKAMQQALMEGPKPRDAISSLGQGSLVSTMSDDMPIELVAIPPRRNHVPIVERQSIPDPFSPLPIADMVPEPVLDADHPLAARVSKVQTGQVAESLDSPILSVEPSPKTGATLAPKPVLLSKQRKVMLTGLLLLSLLIALGGSWIYFRPPGKVQATDVEPIVGDVTLEVEPESATIQIDHIPTKPGILSLEPGKLHVLNVAAAKRITRRFSFAMKPGLVLSIHLDHALVLPRSHDPRPQDNELSVQLQTPARSRADVQRALWKIEIFETCLEALTEGHGVGDARKNIASDDLVRYRAMISKAEAAKPILPRLEGAGRGFLSALQTEAKVSIIQRARLTLHSELLTHQTQWQMEALARQGEDGGKTMGWHMRRIAVWAWLWLRATKALPTQPRLVEKRKVEWTEHHQTLLRLIAKDSAEFNRIGGHQEFLKATSDFAEVLNGTKGTSDSVILETTRRLLQAHNALILES